MPPRASFFLIACIALITSGCSVWPGREHRELTLADIEQLLDQKMPVAQPAPAAAACTDVAALDDKLRRQRLQLVRMNKQLQALTAASPTFSGAECPPREAPATLMDGKTIIGASEWIYLSPPGHHYQARIDSGAATSSLSAVNVVRFERNGKRWVRFWLQHDDEAEPIEIEAPLVRHVLIRQASSDEVDRRPVVSLTVNLGSALQQDTEFTLTDRSQMTYPILLGREFLRDVTLIDVGRRFLHAKFVPDTAPVTKAPVPSVKTPTVTAPPAAPAKKSPPAATAPATSEPVELKKKAAEPDVKKPIKAVPENSTSAPAADAVDGSKPATAEPPVNAEPAPNTP
jgi:hypothetical protein